MCARSDLRDLSGIWLPAVLALALALAACADAGPQSDDDDDDVAQVDASPGGPDAAPGTPDAAPGTPDAAPGTPDAAPGTPDAAPGTPDAAPGAPDAGGGGVACDEAALLPDNDTCADAIDLTAGAGAPGGVTTYGDTRGYANDAEPPAACTSGYGEDGPDAVYRIDATAGDTLSATMTPDGYDGAIYILSDCMDALSCELGADDGFVGGAETLSYPVAATGTYYLFVDAYLATVEGCYTLHVELL